MSDYQVIRENILFRDLSDSDVETLINISEEIDLDAGKIFIREGDEADKFYYILEGKVAIIKSDLHHHDYIIAHLETGETIGEIAFLDNKPRSASAKTEEPTRLLKISFDKLKKLAETSESFDTVLLRIAENLGGRIRAANTATVEALENQVTQYKIRSAIGLFMVNVIVALCLFTFFLSWITEQQAGALSTTTITLPLTLGFVILFVLIMRGSNLPLSTFGLTTKNWRVAVKESLLYTTAFCVFVQFVKVMLIHTTTKYSGHDVFEPYLAINLSKTSASLTPQQVWWMIFAIYWLIVSPLQELIVRGGLQGPLEVFLTEKYATVKAIFVSNLMFATAHLFMGLNISFYVFIAGIYFGWLFSRHHTLIGVILAHAILGTWATMVIGL